MSDYKISDDLRSKINQAFGEVSLCWHPTPKGQFLPDQVLIISRRLVKEIEADVLRRIER